MASLKGTATEKNILTAFCGESQARNRYTYFSAQAKNVQISKIFEETANQEREHAKRLFKLLEGGEVEVMAKFPAGVIGSTTENLAEAAGGEQYEHSIMYPGFAVVAREEGFPNIAAVFEAIAVAERQHEKRYLALKANIEAGRVFAREKEASWVCQNCGYRHEGAMPPQKCPRYLALKANIEAGRVFAREKEASWVCQNCGYRHEGATPPQKCPACDHAQAHFELLAENW